MLRFNPYQDNEDSEDEQISRRLLLMHCSSNIRTILNPTARNPRLSELCRYFDNLYKSTTDVSLYIPRHIQNHLQDLTQHVNQHTTTYWFYTLSYYIQQWMLDSEGNLKADIVRAIGEENLAAIRTFTAKGNNKSDIENSLCCAYFSFLAQYLHGTHPHAAKLQDFSKTIATLNFCNHDILVARKQALLHQYKLCIDNPTHLSFWSQYSYQGFWGQGGVPVQHYYIPSTVHEIMQTCPSRTTEPYEHFLVRINALRHQPSVLSFGRHPVTQLFYDLPDQALETTTVDELVERSHRPSS